MRQTSPLGGGPIAAALHPVYLTAAVVMLAAFGLSWRLRDVPLRETAGPGQPAVKRSNRARQTEARLR